MAAPKVYGFLFSPATLRVLACLKEKEVDFEFVPVDLTSGDHKKEPYISLNPFGQVPAFEEGDLKLIESRAITQHICRANPDKGTALTSPDLKKMAIQSLWMEVEALEFEQLASKLIFQHVFKPMLGLGPTDESAVAELEEKLGKVLDIYEARLSESKYLGGDSFSLADLHHLPSLHFLVTTPSKKLFDSRPHVSKWSSAILDRPSWAKVIQMQKSA